MQPTEQPCSVEGCDRPRYGKARITLCIEHKREAARLNNARRVAADPEGQRKKRRGQQRRRSPRAIENHRKRIAERRRQRRQWLDDYKASHPCHDCQLYWPPYVMHFDHVRGEKVAAVAQLMARAALEAVKEEIAKCELVCANCHAIRTHRRRKEQEK